MANRSQFDHIGYFNFKVEIDGVATATVSQVEGLEQSAAFGGRAGQSGKITLRGVIPLDKSGAQRLDRWRKASEGGARAQKSVALVKYDSIGAEVQHHFYEGWPCKWYVPDTAGSGTGGRVWPSEWKVSEMDGKSNDAGVSVRGWDPHNKKVVIGEIEMFYTGLRLK